MALGKQAKILTKKQIDQLIWYVGTLRHPLRNEVIVMLSVKAGLRAKEIAGLSWSMVTDADGDIGTSIHLTDKASKGRGGRVIPSEYAIAFEVGGSARTGTSASSF